MHFITSIVEETLAAKTTAGDSELEPVRLPRDELRHSHTMEWWYFIAYVTTASGAKGSLLCSAIRRNLVVDVTNCMLKITDHDRGPWPFMECGQPFQGAYSQKESPVGFKIDYRTNGIQRLTCFDGGWTIEGAPGLYRLAGEVGADKSDRRAFDLRLKGTHPAVLLSQTGIMDYGAGYQLAYYVRPKIEVTGTMQLTDQVESVTGVGWYERQWGAWPGDRFGWRYLNVHLDDGEQWLIFASKRNNLERHYAARFPAAGGIVEYDVRPDQIRQVLHGRYPFATDVSVDVDGATVEFEIRPLHPNDESLNSKYPLMPTIWEGLSTVECRRPDGVVKGVAMTEIKPYE